MNFFMQKLKNIDIELLGTFGSLFLFGAITGWVTHCHVAKNYFPGDCLLTRQQVIENLDRQGYKNGPVSICLQFEEFKK